MNFLKKLSLIFLFLFLFPSEIFAVEPGTVIYRTNYGGGQISGTPVWQKDPIAASRFTTTNTIDMTDESIPSGTPENIFKSYRFGPNQNLNLSFPVEPGRYEVRLYFAEISGGNDEVGARIFDISIEGEKVLSNFDVFKTAGKKNKAIKRAFFVTSDSNLNIDFTKIKDNSMVSGIEILKAGPGNIQINPTVTKSGEGESPTINNIDLYVIYDEFVEDKLKERNATIGAYVNKHIALTNNYYANSDVNVKINLAKLDKAVLGDNFATISASLTKIPVDFFETDRQASGADVLLYLIANPKIDSNDFCGMTAQPIKDQPNADYNFMSVIHLGCPEVQLDTTFPHEIAHLLGANHEHAQLPAGAIFSNSRAYIGSFFDSRGNRYTYATMDFDHTTDVNYILTRFSQKGITVGITLPSGETVLVPIGSDQADNVSVMNTYAPTVAAYRSIKSIQNPMHNSDWNADVNRDGKITNDDALIVDYFIKNFGSAVVVGQAFGAVDVNGNFQITVDDANLVRNLLNNPLTPLDKHLDVNGDGQITPLDILNIHNFVNTYGMKKVNEYTPELIASSKKVDANGDGTVSPLDGLVIVNYINSHPH